MTAARRVFVAGATGVVGRRLLPALRDAGWRVRALVRPGSGSGGVPGDVEAVEGDILDPLVASAAADSDVIVHAASAIPRDRGASAGAWERNDRIRRQGTANLLAAAARTGAQLVLQSVAMLYADAGERWIDAASALVAPAVNLVSMLDAEELVAGSGAPALVLRQGLLFGAGTGASRAFLDAVSTASLPPVAGRDVWLSLLDPQDFAEVVVAALDRGLTGTFDVVSDVATISQLIEHAAERLPVEMPRPLSLEQAREQLSPAVLGAWYVSRRVSGRPLAAHGILPGRGWRQMLDSALRERVGGPGLV